MTTRETDREGVQVSGGLEMARALAFDIAEYDARVRKTKQAMQARGLDVLLVHRRRNMRWLTGYDGWSFYVHQLVVIAQDQDQPLWIGRGIDVNGARVTTFLRPEHPPLPRRLRADAGQASDGLGRRGAGALRRSDRRRIGVETDATTSRRRALGALQGALPNASFKDADPLVNWIRHRQVAGEIALMQQAGEIMRPVMPPAIDAIDPGVRQCDAAAAIYRAAVSGTPEFGGDYPAIVPMLPTGPGTSTPHLTWNDAPFRSRRGDDPGARRLPPALPLPAGAHAAPGQPPQRLADTAESVVEGTRSRAGHGAARRHREAVEAAWRETDRRHGLEKESRIGYSSGLNYPPDWGEHTLSPAPRRHDRAASRT